MESNLTSSGVVSSTPSQQRSTNYLGEIDGLRAIAVLAVVAHHFNESLVQSGFLGVDIFFVISGYVISASLANRTTHSLTDSLVGFYARRVKRLMPALIVCVLTTGILASIFSPLPRSSIITGVASLFGLANLYLFRNSTDYFGDTAVSNFFTQTWSLGVEEQFYFLFPLIYLVLTRHQQKQVIPKLFLVVITLSSVASLIAYVYAAGRYPNAAFFLLPFRLWEIALGVLIFHGVSHFGHRVTRPYLLDARLLATLLLATLYLPQDFQTLSTIASVMITGLLLVTIHIQKNETAFLKHPVLTHFGRISYSIYLWHWSVLVLSYWTVGVSMETAPALLLLIYVVALLSYHYLERPLRYRAWSPRKSLEIVYGLATAVLVAVLLISIMDNGKKHSPIYAGNTAQAGTWRINSSLLDSDSPNQSGISSAAIAELEEFQLKKARCHLTPHKLSPTHPYFGKKPELSQEFFADCFQAAGKQVILVGDSFSNVISNHVFVAAREHGFDVNMVFGYNCPFPMDPTNIEWGRGNCATEARRIQSALSEHLKSGDVLVVRLNFPSTTYSGASRKTTEDATGFMDKEFQALSNIANEKNATFVIVGANAALNPTMPCTRPHWFNKVQCPTNELSLDMTAWTPNNFALDFNQHLADLFHTPGGKNQVIDPIAILCQNNGKTCPVYRNGVLYYRDNDYSHLSAAAADLLYPTIVEVLESASN